LAPYILVGDGTYPPQPFMFLPFEGQKDGYSRESTIGISFRTTPRCV
jgi:hypothetical protein